MTEQAKRIEVRLMAMEPGAKTVCVSMDLETARTSAILMYGDRYFVYGYMTPGFEALVFMEVAQPAEVLSDQSNEVVLELNREIQEHFPKIDLKVTYGENCLYFTSETFRKRPESVDGRVVAEMSAAELFPYVLENIAEWIQAMAARGIAVNQPS